MADTAHGDIVYPLGTDGFSVPVKMLAMAESLDPRVIGQYATKAARTTGTSALVAANKRVVAWVDGGVGLCAHDGTAWINLSPPKVYVFANSYASGMPVVTGASFTDTATLSIPGVVNGQIIDIDIRARIRVDGGSRQSILVKVIPSAGTLPQTYEDFVMYQQDYGDAQEWTEFTKYSRFYCDNGTVTFAPYLAAGAGPDRLLLGWFQMKATLHPVDAA